MEEEQRTVVKTESGNEKGVPPEASNQADGHQATPCNVSATSGSPPVGVLQSVPAGTIAAVPLVQVHQNRLQMSPVLVPSASSAFQVNATTAPQQTSSITTGATMSVAPSVHHSAAEASPENGNGHGAAVANHGKVLVQSSPAVSAPQLVAAGSTGLPDRMPSPATLQAAPTVSSLPPGSFYFMLPNNAGTVPTIAPRPASSEAMTSPPVVTATMRPDGSPVAMVAASPMDDSSPGSITPIKRPAQPGSPRESKRRAIHNEVERRRRDKINFWMNKLKEIVPNPAMGGGANTSKGHVLGKTVAYISELKEEMAALQKRYESEHNQLVQCASQHTLLRQQLIDSSLKPAFGFFKIAVAPTNGGPMGVAPGLPATDTKVPDLLAVSVPAGVITTAGTDLASSGSVASSAVAPQPSLAQPSRFGQVPPLSTASAQQSPAVPSAQAPLTATLGQSVVLSPPPLTLVTATIPVNSAAVNSTAQPTPSVVPMVTSGPPALAPGLVAQQSSAES